MDNYLKLATQMYPNAGCELNYTNDFSFLVAVVLSAQTTDKHVNVITPILFNKYKTIESLSNASFDDVYNIIKPLGLANIKSKNLILLAKKISDLGYIPSNLNELIKLPGVGYKTACVYLSEIKKEPHIAVDTHILRVSKRLGLTNETNPLTVSKELEKRYEKSEYIKVHHTFLFLGRYCCKSVKPNCTQCLLKEICNYYNKK
jgi:endonuclease-3